MLSINNSYVMLRSRAYHLILLVSGITLVTVVSYSLLSDSIPDNPLIIDQLEEKSKDVKEKEGIIEQLRNKLACLTKGVLPSGGFCLDADKAYQGGNNVWCGKLCAGLEGIFGYSSVGDFGAGLGLYGSCFLRHGGTFIETSNQEQASDMAAQYINEMTNGQLLDKKQVIRSWEGFDSAFGIEELSQGKIHTTDLSVPFILDHKFDWVMSLEVGEHIPLEKEDVFINNLVYHACKGVILSWAVEGQGGYNHINNRNNNYIEAKMKEKGFLLDNEASLKLREMSTPGWFKNTLMVYRLPSAIC